MNVKLTIEYDGLGFQGWQRQPHGPTVQATIEDALKDIIGKRVVLYGASRTDSGVHAKGQVANFYAEAPYRAEQWKHIINSRLPKTIRVIKAVDVADTFHAQKDAIAKIYEYRLFNREVASALDNRNRALFYPKPLAWEAMRQALPHFIGRHDFRAFCGAKSTVKTTVREIFRFELLTEAPWVYCFVIEGQGFLKQMVRTIMGTVLEIGEGKRTACDVPTIIASRDRTKAGRTLAAHGLCLVGVKYHVV